MENRFYLGIDLDDGNAVLSCYELNMREPETFSMVAGSQLYQIPVLLAKKNGMEQWLIGEEAGRLAMEQGGGSVEALLTRALRQEMVFVDGENYPAEELLCLFLKKLLILAGGIGSSRPADKLVVCVEQLSRGLVELFAGLAPRLGFSETQITLLDRKECFYYFACCQPRELVLHDVYLFDCRDGRVQCCLLTHRKGTSPQLVTITEETRSISGSGQDEAFLRILGDCFQGRIVSSAYLTGDGFDGGWMKRSVSLLCQGRRAFMGKNLYSKGACYAAAVLDGQREWQYVYLGDNEMKVNVSLKVLQRGVTEFYTLISAGANWYETVGECEVLLDGTPEISFWLQAPEDKSARMERLELADLPERPAGTTRLRITAKPLSDERVQIRIRDLGFGEFFRSSGKVWEYVMSLEGE